METEQQRQERIKRERADKLAQELKQKLMSKITYNESVVSVLEKANAGK